VNREQGTVNSSKEQLAMSDEQRKTGHLGVIFTLLFVLCSLLFYIGCPTEPEYPPEGMGWFKLEIEEVRVARTVLPPNSPGKFTKYKLDFFDSDGNEHERVIRKGERVTLPLGIYDLAVTAYTDSALEKMAAWGASVEKIEIKREKTAVARIILEAVMEGGEGTFSWKINYPGNVVAATMTIASWPPNGTPEKTLYFTGGTPETKIGKKDSLTMDAGLYRIVISLLRSNSYSIEYRETVHVYTNMDSLFEHNFAENQFTYIIVTNGNDDGSLGSLRKAIADAKTDSSIIIDSNKVETIALKKRLEINKKLVIEGGGVTVMRDSSWTEIEDKPQLLYVGGGDVTIRSVMFKDNNIYAEGAAVYNKATLALESCIFSGNSNNNKDTSFVYHGGAVYSDRGSTLSVKGCTFYGNTAGGNGSAIAVYTDTGLTLVGNLFYENSQNFGTPVFRVGNGDASGSYNTETVPISPPYFKPSSGAANIIISRPEDYPLYDFYGKDIPDTNAAAGAVQM
jgi:hypothetical protein